MAIQSERRKPKNRTTVWQGIDAQADRMANRDAALVKLTEPKRIQSNVRPVDKGTVIISANNNEQVMVLPTYPYFSVQVAMNNSEFETLNRGNISLIGDTDLWSFSISSILPSQKYYWLKNGSVADPLAYIKFFEKYQHKQVPFRMIATTPHGDAWFNIACTVESVDYEWLKNGDMNYTIDIKEYAFVKHKPAGVIK